MKVLIRKFTERFRRKVEAPKELVPVSLQEQRNQHFAAAINQIPPLPNQLSATQVQLMQQQALAQQRALAQGQLAPQAAPPNVLSSFQGQQLNQEIGQIVERMLQQGVPPEDIQRFIQEATYLPPQKPKPIILTMAPDPADVPRLLSGELIPGIKIPRYRKPALRCVEYGGLKGTFPTASGQVVIRLDLMNAPTRKRLDTAFRVGVLAERGKRAVRHAQLFFAEAGLPLLQMPYPRPVKKEPEDNSGLFGVGMGQMVGNNSAIQASAGYNHAAQANIQQMGAAIGAPNPFAGGVAASPTPPPGLAMLTGSLIGDLDMRDEYYEVVHAFQAGSFMFGLNLSIEPRKTVHKRRPMNGLFSFYMSFEKDKREDVLCLWQSLVLEPLGWTPDTTPPLKVTWDLGKEV